MPKKLANMWNWAYVTETDAVSCHSLHNFEGYKYWGKITAFLSYFGACCRTTCCPTSVFFLKWSELHSLFNGCGLSNSKVFVSAYRNRVSTDQHRECHLVRNSRSLDMSTVAVAKTPPNPGQTQDFQELFTTQHSDIRRNAGDIWTIYFINITKTQNL